MSIKLSVQPIRLDKDGKADKIIHFEPAIDPEMCKKCRLLENGSCESILHKQRPTITSEISLTKKEWKEKMDKESGCHPSFPEIFW